MRLTILVIWTVLSYVHTIYEDDMYIAEERKMLVTGAVFFQRYGLMTRPG